MKYKVAAAQMDSGTNIDENIYNMGRMAKEAAEQGAKLIAFPETAEYMGRGRKEHATEIPGPITERIGEIAKTHEIYINVGVTEKTFDAEDHRPHNTSLLFAPTGQLIAKYRKIHLFDVDISDGVSILESKGIRPGEEIVLCDTELGRLGFSICYDLRFGEQYRLLAMHGAKIITIPADFTYATGEAHWEALVRARAIENGCYVIAANQTGEKLNWDAYGHSMIVDPWGRILTKAERDVGLIYAEIDTDLVDATQRELPSLANRRGDVYQLESEGIHIYEE